MKMKIRELEGEYWLEILHGMVKLMFRLTVRGVVSHRAIEEVIKAQNMGVDPEPPGGDFFGLMEGVDEILDWAKMKGSRGENMWDDTSEHIYNKLKTLADRHRGNPVEN